jgi:Cu-Zn family superoxide dismutase
LINNNTQLRNAMRRQLLVGLSVVSAAVLAQNAGAQAKAELKDAQGKSVGSVTLTEAPHGVLLHAMLMGLPAGTHAFHIHTTGTCEAPAFTSAGGHLNPTSKQHGMMNPMGMHAGDMPNVQMPADGMITFEVFVAGVTLGTGPDGVFKTGGTAIVVHGGADDYKGDPAGNAGPRIACGVVSK